MSTIVGAPEKNIGWIRNPQWLQFPSDDGLDNKCYALYAIFEDDEDTEVGLDIQNITQIDWGDGNVDTGLFSSSIDEVYHTYDYSTLPGPVLIYDDGRNYKQVMIEIICDNSDGRAFMQFGRGPVNQSYGILDCDVRFLGTSFGVSDANSWHIRFGQNQRPVYLERFKAKYPMNNLSFTRGFFNALRLSKLDVQSDFFDNSGFNTTRYFDECGIFSKVPLVIPSIDNSVSTGSQTHIGRNGFRAILGDLNFPNVTSFNAAFLHSHIIKCGNVTAPSCDNAQNMFGGTTGSNSLYLGLGIIDMPNLVTANWMFRGTSVPEIVFTDCSLIFGRTGMFENTGNIRKLIMPNLRRGVDVSNNCLSAEAINDFFTSIGTNLATDPIDVSDNPGAATCDTSIATNKGFTVIT